MPNATWVRTRPTSLFRTWTCAASPFSRMPSTANGTTAWTRMRPTPNRQVKFAQDPKSVVVVVVDEDSQRCLRLIEAAEALAVEHFLLENAPESLDLAVAPGRADLGSQMLDVEVAQALAEAGEHSRHPDHEGEAVVAHQLEWLTAEFEPLVEPSQDGCGSGFVQY